MDTDRFIESVNKKRESAWREMYRKYYPAMCNYASKIVKDDASAEDIVLLRYGIPGHSFPMSLLWLVICTGQSTREH